VERKRGERYGEKFRRQVIKRMNACDNIVKLSRKLGIHRRLLYKWRDDLEKLHRQAGSEIPILNSRETVLRRELNRFKRLLAEKTVELDFFKGALQRVEARRQRSNASGEKASTKRFEMPLQGSLSIERMCQLAQVSRAGFYRYLQGQAPVEEGMIVRSAIQEIALEHRRHYGYRRVTAELRRRGMIANHKRVARMMRADNLLATQHRKLVLEADWTEEREIHLNLARRLKTTGPNQLWIADITYIRLRKEFVYLAVILDAYSRKDVGWALDRTLRARLPLTALEQAILNREPPPGVVHHSDRGIQYASDDYLRVLRDHGMTPSMSRPGNPFENATCESFFKTLKREEIYANDYDDLEHLLETVGTFIERYYNRCRLHSALGYRSPDEFEKEFGTHDGDGSFMGPVLHFVNRQGSG
jgi:putative transposase